MGFSTRQVVFIGGSSAGGPGGSGPPLEPPRDPAPRAKGPEARAGVPASAGRYGRRARVGRSEWGGTGARPRRRWRARGRGGSDAHPLRASRASSGTDSSRPAGGTVLFSGARDRSPPSLATPRRGVGAGADDSGSTRRWCRGSYRRPAPVRWDSRESAHQAQRPSDLGLKVRTRGAGRGPHPTCGEGQRRRVREWSRGSSGGIPQGAPPLPAPRVPEARVTTVGA